MPRKGGEGRGWRLFRGGTGRENAWREGKDKLRQTTSRSSAQTKTVCLFTSERLRRLRQWRWWQCLRLLVRHTLLKELDYAGVSGLYLWAFMPRSLVYFSREPGSGNALS